MVAPVVTLLGASPSKLSAEVGFNSALADWSSDQDGTYRVERGGAGWGTGVLVTAGACASGVPITTTIACPGDFGADTETNGPGLGTNYRFNVYARNAGLETGSTFFNLTVDLNVSIPMISGAVLTNSATANDYDIITGLDHDVVDIDVGAFASIGVSIYSFVNHLDGSGAFKADLSNGDGSYDVQIYAIDNVDNTSSDSNISTIVLDTTNPLVVILSASTEGGIGGTPPAVGKVCENAGFMMTYVSFYWNENPVVTGGYFAVHVKDGAFGPLDKPLFNTTTKRFIGGGGVPLFGDGTFGVNGAIWQHEVDPVQILYTGRNYGLGAGQNGPMISSNDSGVTNYYQMGFNAGVYNVAGMPDVEGNGPGLGTNLFVEIFVADLAGNVSDPT